MLTLSNLAIRRGTKVLFEQASFKIHRGNRVGITGANGCGKSSLFALILKQIHSDAGDLTIPQKTIIAHVAQETPATQKSAIDYALDGDVELRNIQQQLAEAENIDDGAAQAECHSRLEEINAYTAESRAGKLLLGLSFTTEQLTNPVSSFSGGWRMRLNLAQALMCRSDLLLLDEPTNHLDLDAVIWLEQWLLNYTGTMLLISHDRDFLDKVTSHIVHIEQQSVNLYTGNYSAFEKLRAEKLALQKSQYDKQQREIAHIESFIRRFKAKASKAKQAQGRVKALERMEMISAAHIDSPFNFSFFKPEKLPHPLMTLDDINVGYGDVEILKGASLSLLPGDRIALLGHNGAGKSTLIKLLAGELQPQKGEFEQSSELKIGYFAQHQLEQLDLEASALLHLQRLDSKLTEQQIRSYLGGFDFHGDRVLESVGPFSGGEKARLVLALLIYQKPNILLLDEPTNHLDLEMRHALSLALQEYEGAMVLVSHDRHLLRAVTDQFLLVDEGKVKVFNDDLDAYRNWLLQPKTSIENELDSSNEPKAVNKKTQRQQLADQRKLLNPLTKEIKSLEKAMGSIEQEIETIEVELSKPEMYEAENREQMEQLSKHRGDLSNKLEEIEENWLLKSEELTLLTSQQTSE
ncbi:MAG: ABC transporter ATP-binding protein [endosymbiont of Galathealinum brachiosum]|uniref:Probable ATP-binding protein YheS n=2 Tax=root TaxID=1 RepID=A0A370DD07_9GAMM|nr:MAG: ABC transporter ATP-binding protein [endosymbiont of Galathealinum brachiosum]